MSETIVMESKGGRETTCSRAVAALSELGVTRILPELWEVVTFEANLSNWNHRDFAKRYLALLRDAVNRSALRVDR